MGKISKKFVIFEADAGRGRKKNLIIPIIRIIPIILINLVCLDNLDYSKNLENPENLEKSNKTMKEHILQTRIEELTPEELSPQECELVNRAKEATRRSMADYSKFHVGAALLLDNGEIIEGSNQENAAYTSGTCAERSACFYAGARYPDVPFRKLAIAAWTSEGKPEGMDWEYYFQRDPISPCGLCRQALLEYETKSGAPIELLLYGRDRIYRVRSVADLLPLCFTEF